MGPTAAQVAFAFVALVVGPGFGGCGATAARSTTLRASRGFWLAAGACWVGLALSGLVAALLFRRYPLEGPPEKVAILFVLPALAAGTSMVVHLLRRPTPRKDGLVREGDLERDRRSALVSLLGGLSASALGLLFLYVLLTTPLHRALPWSATDVRESYWYEGFLPDYSDRLRARVPEHEAAAYAARLALQPYDPEHVPDGLQWGPSTAPDDPLDLGRWATPPLERGRAWVWRASQGDESLVVAWRDGWLYAVAGDH